MKRFIFWLLGWRRFTAGDVTVYQRNVMIDQTQIVDALESTTALRTFCPDRALTIYIDESNFRGLRGAEARAELVRYKGRRPSADLRLAPQMVSSTIIVDLLRGLNRVD